MKIGSFRVLVVICFFTSIVLTSGCVTAYHVHPGHTDVVKGESVTIIVNTVKGTPPKTLGMLTKKSNAPTDWSQPIAMNSDNGRFIYVFNDIEENLEYRLNVTAEGAGPYSITVNSSKDYDDGYRTAIEYMKGNLPDYRIVINLHIKADEERNDFLDGFASAFSEKKEGEKGNRYTKVLRETVTTDSYDVAFNLGAKHVNAEVTNAQIQELIRSSIGVSSGVALGWKAGYIKGFSEEMAKKTTGTQPTGKPIKETGLYDRAARMYEALRAASGR